jgi:hypothetical protein
MSLIKPQRSGDVQIPGFFTKQDTEADISRFVGAEAGRREIIRKSDATYESPTDSYVFTLSTMQYLVGANQLMVLSRNGYLAGGSSTAPQGFTNLLPKKEDLLSMQDSLGSVQVAGVFNETSVIMHYEEVSSDTVRVYHIGGLYGSQSSVTDLLFLIPHTATPALSQERVTVKDQGDNEAVILEGKGDGVLMTSPDGSRYLLRVNNNGTLAVEPR